MTTYKIILSIVLTFLSDALFSQISSYKTLSITVETDKKEYFPFEPIFLTTEFKNITKVNQWYYEPQILYTSVNHKIYYKKKEIHPYLQFDEVLGRGGAGEISEDTAIEPGDSKISVGVISKYFDLSGKYGNVTIEVGYPKLGEINGQWGYTIGYKTESTTVKIVKEPLQEIVPVQLFSEAVSKMLGRNGYDNVVKENLEKLLSEYPNSYLIDQAYYFLIYYYLQAYNNENKSEQLDAARNYLVQFMDRFPQSIYRKEAEGLRELIKKI
jgi:hypothetical protein